MEDMQTTNRPLFAWITEFGIACPDAIDSLNALEDRVRRLEEPQSTSQSGEREYDHCLIASLGNRDILEIAYFTHIYHFFEIAETAAHSSRNSLGARCPTEEELERSDRGSGCYRLLDLTEILEEEDPQRPFVGILYLSFSTAARLCIPAEADLQQRSSGNQTLTDQFLSGFFRASAPVWELYEKTYSINRGSHISASLPLRLAPLIGLDGADMIFVFRAENLEQIAALTFAVRHQRLESIWPAGARTQFEPYVIAMRDLLKEGSLPEISDEWNSSPLCKEIRTSWGMPVRPATEGSKGPWEWRLEECAEERIPAASAAVTFTLMRAAPDRFAESCNPVGLVASMNQRELLDPRPQHALTMSGRTDTLWLPTAVNALQRITIKDIRRHLEGFARFKLDSTAPPADRELYAGLWPITEIAVSLKLPADTDFPTYDLMKRFRRVVHSFHTLDFSRAGDSSWTQRWLAASKELGSPYSTTSTIVNLISSFMGFLERDPEGFADLLPPLYRLVEIVERSNPPPGDLLWLVARIRNFFSSMNHRHYALQSAGTTTPGVEGNAGYRRSGDAFMALTKDLSSEIMPDCQILVLERAGGLLTCELGPFDFIVLWVPPFILHYPVAWHIVPELVFARIDKTKAVNLPPEIRDTLRRLLGRPANPGDTVRQELAHLGNFLISKHSIASRLCIEPLVKGFDELVADLALWRSLQLRNDTPTDTTRKFWFVHGPGLIAASVATFGVDRSSISAIQLLILRIFFANRTIQLSSERGSVMDRRTRSSWNQELEKLLGSLEKLDFHLEEIPHTCELGYRDRTSAHLHCLRLDLRIPDEKWLTAVRVLRRGVSSLNAEAETALSLVERWLECAQQLVDHWLINEAETAFTRALYNEYLTTLLDAWPATSDPWPPFIPHHKVEIDRGRNVSVVRSRIREDNPAGGFISLRGGVFVADSSGGLEGQKDYHRKTGYLIKRLADHLRGVRLQELRALR